MALYDNSLKFMADMGWNMIRIDSGAPPVLPENMSYEAVKDFIKEMFTTCARHAADYGIQVVWEFEPGFIINEPKNIVEVVKDVGQENFSLLFDTCHGHMSAVVGARHMNGLHAGRRPGVLRDGQGSGPSYRFDGTLNVAETSTHAPFGDGVIDFDTVIPALLDVAGQAIAGHRLCEWPDAWNATARCKAFVDALNEKYCK